MERFIIFVIKKDMHRYDLDSFVEYEEKKKTTENQAAK